ncbi:MAG TPA: methyltransferase domain-containing protein [Casimicrobiaceae bacterium]|nr:methyltransferase domain-containing protein [Casimicrobiaceae bacterium]
MQIGTAAARLVLLIHLVALGCGLAAAADTPGASDGYAAAIASPIRTDQDRRMDASRHPAQFLPFTQVKPGMKVLDISAGAGYTSQLLALAVGPKGTVYAQAPNPGATLSKRVADHPQPNLVIVARGFEDPIPPDAPKLDLVTLVNNYHDISYMSVDRPQMLAKIYAALKPGGHFVVIDHSAKTGTGISVGRTLHRIDEDVVRKEVTQAGFKLEAEGDFLRNPADAREDSSNSPAVPTDKFALRFVKPA